MNVNDIYLISPEISLVGLGLLLLSLDLLWKKKEFFPYVAFLGLLLPIILSVCLWYDVSNEIGGELTGIKGALIVDKFSIYFKFIVLGALGLVVLTSTEYLDRVRDQSGEFLPLLIFSATGMMFLVSASELITIYVSLELTTLPLIALIGFLRHGRSSEAALKFLILSGISSALLLYGMILVWGFSGSTYLTAIAKVVDSQANSGIPFGSYALLLGVILVVAGFAFKVSAVPFHMWVPDIYEGGTTHVVAFLSVASKSVAFAVLLRVFYIGFGSLELEWSLLFAVLSAFSMTLGNLVAMVQTNIKRLLGYSTIAHAGYMLIGLAAVASRIDGDYFSSGPGSLLFYLAAYVASNLAAFFAVISITRKINSDRIEDFAGMGRKAPLQAMGLTIGLISLIGLPPTGLFIGKIMLFTSAVDAGLIWLAILGVINSVVSAYYYLKVVRIMYVSEARTEEAVFSTIGPKLALLASAIIVVTLGIIPGVLTGVTDAAAIALLP
ncbi:MAG: NADH-quinone oxidoreductase subunit N [Dehalococcoidia bacterium]|nr:NADH-quinone oxidoreductase subunit N [Dehalococcoidia bacterium]